jgi:hypothetical protein
MTGYDFTVPCSHSSERSPSPSHALLWSVANNAWRIEGTYGLSEVQLAWCRRHRRCHATPIYTQPSTLDSSRSFLPPISCILTSSHICIFPPPISCIKKRYFLTCCFLSIMDNSNFWSQWGLLVEWRSLSRQLDEVSPTQAFTCRVLQHLASPGPQPERCRQCAVIWYCVIYG